MSRGAVEAASAASSSHENHGAQEPHVRRRRKSSGLGGEPRGDTDAPALATTANRLSLESRPSTPTQRGAEHSSKRGRKRRKVKGWFRRWKRISLRHTWLNPLIISLAVLAVFLTNPTPSNPVYPAVALSYPLPRKAGDGPDAPIHYGKGAHDFSFVAFYIVVLSFTREFCMQRIWKPLAVRAGIRSRAKQSRFMEQCYTAMYFAVFGPFGLYIMSRSPVWYFNTEGMYAGFPHYTHEGLFKAYYLLQASYWAQQMLVMLLMLEKPRKDFKELVAHHFITLTLIWLSYRFHFTYMGLAVYITHDISDFFLATSKVFNYMQWSIVGPYLGIFAIIWTYLRHYSNLRIIVSMLPLPLPPLTRWLISQLPPAWEQGIYASPTLSAVTRPIFPDWHSQFATVGPFDLNWDTQQYKCWISSWITFGLLAALQSVNVFWFFLILRIMYRYLRTGGAKDERSDDEASEEEDVGGKDDPTEAPKSSSKSESPTVLLNGTPLTPAGSSELPAEKAARRSPRKKATKG